jgi:spore coat polysaccharide biosynthesis protein SpsF
MNTPSPRPRTLAIVQARMGSQRLPGKTLQEIGGKPMLGLVLERISRASQLDGVVVATTRNAADDPVAKLGVACGADVYLGSVDDVLDRYYQAARLYGAELIVRVTGDCPLVSPCLIDEAVTATLETGVDYTSNSRPISTFPEGLDVEVFTFAALEWAWREAVLGSEREHVTPYMWKHPDLFRLTQLRCPETLPRIRLTVDNAADLQFVRAVFERAPAHQMGWRELVQWIAARTDRLPCNTVIARDAGYMASIETDVPRMPRTSKELEVVRPGRVVAVVQARVGATRLRGKTTADIEGKPLIEHVFDRARACRSVDEVVLATTRQSEDKALLRVAARCGVATYAGSTADVLDRFYQAAARFHADTIVRITADDPFKDPQVIDQVVARFQSGGLDYASNTIEPSYPEGLDVEVFSRAALNRAWRDATLRSDREHVTPYIWRQPQLFQVANVRLNRDLSHLRWTLDYPDDLQFARAVYGRLYRGRIFGMSDMLELLAQEPELALLNNGFQRNAGYIASLESDRKEAGIGTS